MLVASLLWFRPFSEHPQVRFEPQHVVDREPRRALVIPASPEVEQAPAAQEGILVDAEPQADELVAGSPAEPPPRRTRRPICRDRSYTEAAMSEDMTCIPRAIVLPDPAERARWIRTRTIDRPSYPVSTTDRPDPR
jgi:hypothetical protein